MLRGLQRWIAPAEARTSFSQCGEDRIVRWILDMLGVAKPRYLDVGAHHPRRLSNTFLFHEAGGSGVLVEPNPRYTALIRSQRPLDVCLAAGMGAEARERVPFYLMRSDTLCTFSRQEAERMVAECDEAILEVTELPVVTPAAVQAEHFRDGLHFVSLDVEGLELEILGAFDLAMNRPEVFCIETISYAIDGSGRKAHDVIRLMESRGYMNFADTYINTIFVDRARWEAQGGGGPR